jgi:NADH-quinone oxidoreductase subunit C
MTRGLNLVISDIFHILKNHLKYVITLDGDCIRIQPENLIQTATFIKTENTLAFNYLEMITASDFKNEFELIYRFLSLGNNRTLCIKTRIPKDNPCISSLTPLWQGANYQEREIFDLFGIRFDNHPNLKRIVMWEGFEGHPLCKDYTHDNQN